MGKSGYRSEGTAGYCFGSWVPGAVPFLRFVNSVEHFYTIRYQKPG
jgi:hypothetical protein